MTPVIVPAPVGLAVDTSVKLRSPTALDALAARNFQGVIRYVPLPGVSASQDIDPAELEMILVHPGRFWSCWVQHPRLPGWKPRECNAETDAVWAAAHAHSAGYANGVTGYVDIEGMALDTTADEAFAYAVKWCEVLTDQGFTPGAYWGYQQPIPPERRGLVGAKTHWSDAGKRTVTGRGCAMHQGQQFTMLGYPWDPDEVAPDEMGEMPLVMRAAVMNVSDVA